MVLVKSDGAEDLYNLLGTGKEFALLRQVLAVARTSSWNWSERELDGIGELEKELYVKTKED